MMMKTFNMAIRVLMMAVDNDSENAESKLFASGHVNVYDNDINDK